MSIDASTTRTRRSAPVVAGVTAAVAAAYLAANDPMRSGRFLPCPFREITGWSCPGCGITRATHHLLHGDVAMAMRQNVFAPFVLVAIGLAWCAWLSRDTFDRPLRRPQLNAVTAPLTLLLLAVYGLARNLT